MGIYRWQGRGFRVGVAHLFTRIETHQRHDPGSVAVAMEGDNGYARPLDRLVQARGYRLYNINHLKLARFKEIFPGAATTDRRGFCQIVRFTIVTHDFYWSRINDYTSARGLQGAEKVSHRRSRIAQRLNVPTRTPRLLARCGLVWEKARLGAPGLGG